MENGTFFLSPLGLLVELWPGFRHLDPIFGYSYKKSRELGEKIESFAIKEVQKHRENMNFDAEPRDYIEAFLIEQKKQGYENIKQGEWSDKQLVSAVLDLFGAGTETTSTTIRTFILYMIRDPNLQDVLYNEIITVIGDDKPITMNDQQSLPFLQACIQEIQRILVLVKMNLQHKTLDDVFLEGYKIPKDTNIVGQFQSIHLDDDCFSNPKEFNPFRHLKNGKFVKNDLITPFSVGKRSCLGEGLAKMELVLFIGNLFQKFKFLAENDGELPPIKFGKAMINAPDAFKTRVFSRKQ
uniref:Cytochrome P450 n=1 Tax=Panagrolaimus sp. JU765 TaxID=591449 RepID=A0AC34PZZ9_9BILA